MATRLTVTIDQGAAGKDGETRRAELAQAIEAVERVCQALLTTQATSGTVMDATGRRPAIGLTFPRRLCDQTTRG
jgi:hypothetical protein